MHEMKGERRLTTDQSCVMLPEIAALVSSVGFDFNRTSCSLIAFSCRYSLIALIALRLQARHDFFSCRYSLVALISLIALIARISRIARIALRLRARQASFSCRSVGRQSPRSGVSF